MACDLVPGLAQQSLQAANLGLDALAAGESAQGIALLLSQRSQESRPVPRRRMH